MCSFPRGRRGGHRSAASLADAVRGWLQRDAAYRGIARALIHGWCFLSSTLRLNAFVT
jgi:hypothetical protein|tara:strand:- start:659 stop:832 length:174 start_codon:yes stop_codon:yes gene_type:complete